MQRTTRFFSTATVTLSLGSVLLANSVALGQAAQRAAFLANDGNLEGSVSSYLVNEDGSLEFVEKFITGADQDFDYGTNAHAISLAPGGSHLAIGHATGDPPPGFPPGRQVTVLRVHEDATLTHELDFLTPAMPLGVQWLDDEHLAVTRTNLSLGSMIFVYHIDVDAGTATEIDAVDAGQFSAGLALHPSGEYLYAESTFDGNQVRTFAINEDFTLMNIQTFNNGPVFPLGPAVAPNGQWLYAGGGISDGGDKVSGLAIDEHDGTLQAIPGTPFTSPGSSPRQVVVSSDSQVAVAGHGTDGNVHTFMIDQQTGALSSTGVIIDGGGQGNLQDMDVLDALLLVPGRGFGSTNPQGLASFEIMGDGSLELRNDYVNSQGVAPSAVVGWSPKIDPDCPEDFSGDGQVGVEDLLILLGAWGRCDDPTDCPSDLSGDGHVGVEDLLLLLGAWGECP